MTPEQFTYWLQGFMETADPKSIDEKQTRIIKDHLDLVFNKVTPEYKNTPIINYPPGIRDFSNPYDYTKDFPIFPNQTIC